MKKPIKFGTDGWRGVIADDFTFANVRFCAQGVADYLKQKGLAGQGVYIGYDRRFASEDFAAAAAEVIAGNGVKVLLSPQAIPTPWVSFGVISKKDWRRHCHHCQPQPRKMERFQIPGSNR
jgi:phosphomannomutase